MFLVYRVWVSQAMAGFGNSEAFWANPPTGQMERGAREAQGIVQSHLSAGGPSSEHRLVLTLALQVGWHSQVWHMLHHSSKLSMGVSLVAQWLRIHLPRQGTRVQALVQEDPTSRRATKAVCHNY